MDPKRFRFVIAGLVCCAIAIALAVLGHAAWLKPAGLGLMAASVILFGQAYAHPDREHEREGWAFTVRQRLGVAVVFFIMAAAVLLGLLYPAD